MSLIHDAIREMDKGTNPAASGLPLPLTTRRASGGSQLLPAVGGFAAVLAVSAAGWWLWQTYRPMPVDLAATEAAQVVAAPAPVLPGVAAPVTAPAPVLNAAPPATEPVVLASVVTPAPAQATVRPAVRPKRNRPTPVTATPAPQAPVEDVPLEKRFALFLQAMKTNDLPGAGEQLKALQARLPAGTLSRSRAEAWFALRSGQDATARQAYRDILEKAPGDEEASVNLASIEARADRREVAREVLSSALRNNPDSEVLKHAVNRFTAPAAN